MQYPSFSSQASEVLFWLVVGLIGFAIAWASFQIGRAFGRAGVDRKLADREQELFTAQKGFRKVYESDIEELRAKNAALEAEVQKLTAKTEEYRRKVAGLGGLFGSSSRRSEAMYALLLENESLEEALLQQNAKLQANAGDVVKEQLRQVGYRRVLLRELMADDRVKGVMSEMLTDDRRLPAPQQPQSNGQPRIGTNGHEQ
jgi:cell division protein FtsB